MPFCLCLMQNLYRILFSRGTDRKGNAVLGEEIISVKAGGSIACVAHNLKVIDALYFILTDAGFENRPESSG